MTQKEKMDWVNKFKNDKSLYNDEISNIIWVYEECKSTYNNCSNKNALAKMGPLSLFQLKTYVSWMHIICPLTDIQAYAVKSGTGCHYQIPYKELFEF